MNPRVKAVAPRDDYTLEITFTNGEVGIFGCTHLLSFGVFTELEDIRYFRRARVAQGTVVCPHDWEMQLFRAEAAELLGLSEGDVTTSQPDGESNPSLDESMSATERL